MIEIEKISENLRDYVDFDESFAEKSAYKNLVKTLHGFLTCSVIDMPLKKNELIHAKMIYDDFCVFELGLKQREKQDKTEDKEVFFKKLYDEHKKKLLDM